MHSIYLTIAGNARALYCPVLPSALCKVRRLKLPQVQDPLAVVTAHAGAARDQHRPISLSFAAALPKADDSARLLPERVSGFQREILAENAEDRRLL